MSNNAEFRPKSPPGPPPILNVKHERIIPRRPIIKSISKSSNNLRIK
jgi:hypothetical protein